MPMEGTSVYEPEVMEMLKRLKAKSIVMVVVDGNRNKSPIEYASAIDGASEIYNIIRALEAVAASMRADLVEILSNPKYRRNPVN